MLANIQILFNARANPLDIRQANSNLLELFERKECFYELMQLLPQSSQYPSLSPLMMFQVDQHINFV
jgi:hypothetical protein